MPIPPGWEWIEDADYWEAPEELQKPVPSVDINLAIKMLSRGSLGNDFNVLVGQFISESQTSTIWFHAAKGGELSPPELGRHLVEGRQRTRRVYEAWRNLDEGREGTWDDRLLALMATIQAVIDEMRAERTGG
ncbi:hypothetical protein AB0L41_19175 [Amycolatopsis mediterranei]|uniref:hypothetical protein n=1 Tax=Amycolatopsis mediterranei TaxID=33910 RepID=UPI003428EEAD